MVAFLHHRDSRGRPVYEYGQVFSIYSDGEARYCKIGQLISSYGTLYCLDDPLEYEDAYLAVEPYFAHEVDSAVITYEGEECCFNIFHEPIIESQMYIKLSPLYDSNTYVYTCDNLTQQKWITDPPSIRYPLGVEGFLASRWEYDLAYVCGSRICYLQAWESEIFSVIPSPYRYPGIHSQMKVNLAGVSNAILANYNFLTSKSPNEYDVAQSIVSVSVDNSQWTKWDENLDHVAAYKAKNMRSISSEWWDNATVSPEAQGAIIAHQRQMNIFEPKTPPEVITQEMTPVLTLFDQTEICGNTYHGQIDYQCQFVRLSPEDIQAQEDYWSNMPDLPFTSGEPITVQSLYDEEQSVPAIAQDNVESLYPPLEHGSRLALVAKDTYRFYEEDSRYLFLSKHLEGSQPSLPQIEFRENPKVYTRLNAILGEIMPSFPSKWEAVQWMFEWVLWSLGHPSWQRIEWDLDREGHAHTVMASAFPFSAFILHPYDYLGQWLYSLSDDTNQFPEPTSLEEVKVFVHDFFVGHPNGEIPFFDRKTGTGRFSLVASNYTREIYPYAITPEDSLPQSLEMMAYLINAYFYAPWIIFPCDNFQEHLNPEYLGEVFRTLNEMQGLPVSYFQATDLDYGHTNMYFPIQVRSQAELLPFEDEVNLFSLEGNQDLLAGDRQLEAPEDFFALPESSADDDELSRLLEETQEPELALPSASEESWWFEEGEAPPLLDEVDPAEELFLLEEGWSDGEDDEPPASPPRALPPGGN